MCNDNGWEKEKCQIDHGKLTPTCTIRLKLILTLPRIIHKWKGVSWFTRLSHDLRVSW